jgi:hypothetical protein
VLSTENAHETHSISFSNDLDVFRTSPRSINDIPFRCSVLVLMGDVETIGRIELEVISSVREEDHKLKTQVCSI